MQEINGLPYLNAGMLGVLITLAVIAILVGPKAVARFALGLDMDDSKIKKEPLGKATEKDL